MSITPRLVVPALTLAAALLVSGARVRTDDPVSSSVRFTGEIVRILDRRCLACHDARGLSMPLANYRDVRAWGRAIREEIVEQRMPPWSAARGYGRFRNDLSLTAREMTTVLSWIDGGMPRGDDRDLPPGPAPAAAAAPDLRVALPPQRVPALEEQLVRRVTVTIPIDLDRPIARVVLVPGAREVLRGALIYDAADRWIGAWLPWQRETASPSPHAVRLGRDPRVTVELHYRGGDAEIADESTLEVYYAPKTAPLVDEISVDGRSPAPLPRNATLWAIVPTTGGGTRSLELKARRPDGATDVLLWIPQVHPEWPQAFVLDTPLALPAGTTVSLVAQPPGTAARARLGLLR
jgi:hypothetical protein